MKTEFKINNHLLLDSIQGTLLNILAAVSFDKNPSFSFELSVVKRFFFYNCLDSPGNIKSVPIQERSGKICLQCALNEA